MKDEMYYIGKVEKMCKISKKTLRYYDKVGILSPDEVLNENGYRYYSKDNMLSIPLIKYYKQIGFKLEEIKKLIHESEYRDREAVFREKIDELEELEKEISLKKKAIKDWHSLVKEAKMVIANNFSEVTVKYIDKCEMIFLDQEFNYSYIDSIINIEFTNYIESIENEITGPVIIEFPSYECKMKGNCKKMRIIQQSLLKCEKENTVEFGGGLFVSCYHIGSHDNISNTYKKLKEWMVKNGYDCEEKSYERYLVDYWTSKDSKNYVTEILIKIKES